MPSTEDIYDTNSMKAGVRKVYDALRELIIEHNNSLSINMTENEVFMHSTQNTAYHKCALITMEVMQEIDHEGS